VGATTAVVEKLAGSIERRPLYFATFLLLADIAFIALVLAFVHVFLEGPFF
jgi:hypothetical protein